MAANETLEKLKPSEKSSSDIQKLVTDCYEAINDDFNTAIVIANLFEAVRIINSVNAGSETISAPDLEALKRLVHDFVFNILGLKADDGVSSDDTDGLMQFIIRLRAEAKTRKDYSTSDEIRDELGKLGFSIKDTKDGATWEKT